MTEPIMDQMDKIVKLAEEMKKDIEELNKATNSLLKKALTIPPQCP